MARRTLIAYYSMTGNTRKIADELRTAMGADCEEIHEPRTRHGVSGMLRAMVDTLARREPAIDPVLRDPLDYDLLVLGGPVWAGRIAAPVRTYAHRYGALAPEVAFFCTEGGRGSDSAFAELQQFCKHAPKATLALDAQHLETETHRDSLQRFAAAAHPAPH